MHERAQVPYCDHRQSEKTLTRRTIKDGRVQVYWQCQRCGGTVGGPVGRAEVGGPVDQLPAFDLERAARWRARKEAAITKIVMTTLNDPGKPSSDYQAYLASTRWAAKREAVMRRCGGVCEGCGEATATEVHHLSYDHVYDEFLWELVAVCAECHRRAHYQDGA